MTCDAFHRAYFAPPIASVMAAYQDGYHVDMLAMVNLQLPPHLSRCIYPNAAYTRLAAVLDPWLLEYGLSRLPRLFERLDEMHAIMLLYATYSGRVDVVDVALKHRVVTRGMMLLLMDVAAWKNQRRVLDFLQRRQRAWGGTYSSFECSPLALVAAAREGYLDIVRFLHEHFPTVPSTEDAMDMAAEFGHLDIVQYLHEHRSEGCTTRAMNHAAKNGHLAVLRFLHAHRSEGCTERAMDWACEHGHLDVAQWLVEHRSKEGFTEKAFDLAAGNNHLAVVEFLHGLQALSTEKAMDLAAGNGHLSMVQWLHQHRPLQGCTEEAMDKAAANGHLDVVQWLHENRSEGGTSVGFCGAAGAGHLDVLKWLVAHRPDDVCTAIALQCAVGQNRAQVVEWLVNQCHDVPSCVSVNADMDGFKDFVEFLRQKHPQVRVKTDFRTAIRGGDLSVIKSMLIDGEQNTSGLLDEAASCGHLHVVQWLHAQSFPATANAMDSACENGHLHVVRWLHRHRDEGCTDEAMLGAIENGHLSIVQWLHRHRIHDISDFTIDDAATRGDLTMIEYLHTHHASWKSVEIAGAFEGGHFMLVHFLQCHRRKRVSSKNVDLAVKFGHLALAKWLVATCNVTITVETLVAAVESGDLTMLKWVLGLWENDLEDTWLADDAAQGGLLSVMQYLRELGCDWSENGMDGAAASGYLAVLVALQSQGLRCTSDAMNGAAQAGHVQVVRWLHSNGYSGCARPAMQGAAARGKLAVVAYLHAEMCPASGNSILVAAWSEKVHVVKWLVSHGVACTAEVLAWAEQCPTFAAAKCLLAYRVTRQGSSASVEAKRRRISHDSNDGHSGGDEFEDN